MGNEKKAWVSPRLYVISNGSVGSGLASGAVEKAIQTSPGGCITVMGATKGQTTCSTFAISAMCPGCVS